MHWDTYVYCGRHVCSGEIANNVKCMHTSCPGYVIDCIAFI